MVLLELEANLNGLIEGDHLVDGRRGVVAVATVVHPAAFDLKDESFLVREPSERGPGHRGQRGRRGNFREASLLVHHVGDMAFGEHAQPTLVPRGRGEIRGGPEHGVFEAAEVSEQIAFVFALIGPEMVARAAEGQVDPALEILGGNIITAPPGVDAGDESGRRGVGNFGGGHQAPLPARLSEEFVEGD